jgi:hypothetical protein
MAQFRHRQIDFVALNGNGHDHPTQRPRAGRSRTC